MLLVTWTATDMHQCRTNGSLQPRQLQIHPTGGCSGSMAVQHTMCSHDIPVSRTDTTSVKSVVLITIAGSLPAASTTSQDPKLKSTLQREAAADSPISKLSAKSSDWKQMVHGKPNHDWFAVRDDPAPYKRWS